MNTFKSQATSKVVRSIYIIWPPNHAGTHAPTNMPTHKHTHTNAHTDTHTDTRTHTNTHTHSHTQTHTDTHTHTNTHTHTHTQKVIINTICCVNTYILRDLTRDDVICVSQSLPRGTTHGELLPLKSLHWPFRGTS